MVQVLFAKVKHFGSIYLHDIAEDHSWEGMVRGNLLYVACKIFVPSSSFRSESSLNVSYVSWKVLLAITGRTTQPHP